LLQTRPDAAEQRAEKEADDDFDYLGDPPVVGQVGGVHCCFSHLYVLSFTANKELELGLKFKSNFLLKLKIVN
jgi:hypothetical protein